jgi:hypothetical protein
MHFFFPFFILLDNLLIQPRFLNKKGLILGFDPFVSGGMASHHIVAGTLGILVGLFHPSVCSPPPPLPNDYIKHYVWGMLKLFYLVILSSYFLPLFVVARTMWCDCTFTNLVN